MGSEMCIRDRIKFWGVFNRMCQKIAKFLILNYGQAPIKIGLSKSFSELYLNDLTGASKNEKFLTFSKEFPKCIPIFFED